MSNFGYNPLDLEPRWQTQWESAQVFRTPTSPEELKKKPKYYVLDMFPYPSGDGLHIGHPEGYTATDVIARFKRMQGYNVLHPMGWDAFGLPTERAAVRDGQHPALITKRNVDRFRAQLKRLGFSYDWSREVDTSNADYYKWTQWIFLKLHEKGLAYLAEVPVNWCPALGTVLANEEVKDGVYVETGDPVERRMMKQWMLKITAYAERLLADLDGLDWPIGVIEMQRHWIGKSLGAEIHFEVEGANRSFHVFTTRPDTLFGVTFMVIAPEHPLVSTITSSAQKPQVDAYVTEAKNKSDLARTDLAKNKTGVFTGAYALHPVHGARIPIWIADYVLMTYGTGAIMAVPGHDERDHEFARTFSLPILEVISGGSRPVIEAAHTGEGQLVNSDFLNGLTSTQAIAAMSQWLETQGKGTSRVQYRLRDWLFSRQRYWGEPFPMAYLPDGSVTTLDESWLPVELPALEDFRPTEDGQPPLARAPREWLEVRLADGRIARRETNTMPQWAGSCWYYLRFLDPHNKDKAWAPELEQYWMPVDLYIGGVEHAVLHLLYARFWHKVLFDCGLVSTQEPFKKLFNQGMILAYSYQDERGKYYYPHQAEERTGKFFVKGTDTPLKTQIEKMSKSKYNVVNPDEIVDRFGADALRLYELFMGPLDQVKPWQTEGMEGVSRFLARAWRLIVDESTGHIHSRITDAPGPSAAAAWKLTHRTIDKVSKDTESLGFNTAISAMMILLNELSGSEKLPKEIALLFVRVLAPYAPHLCEELWSRLGGEGFVSLAPWPVADAHCLQDTTVKVVLQINGKRRDELEVERGLSRDALKALALSNEKVLKFLAGATPSQVIVVPDRIVNLVVKNG